MTVKKVPSKGAHGSVIRTPPDSKVGDAGERGFVYALKRLRETAGFSLRQLERATKEHDWEAPEGKRGINYSTLYSLEQGRAVPNLRHIKLLARAFGIQPSELVFDQPYVILRKRKWEKAIAEVPNYEESAHHYLLGKRKYRYARVEPTESNTEAADLPHGMEAALLTAQNWNRVIQTYLFEVDADFDDTMLLDGLAHHEGEEVLQVIEGPLELWLRFAGDEDPKRWTLQVGDIVQYPAHIDHGYRSAREDKHPARALFCFVWRGQPHKAHVRPTMQTGRRRTRASSLDHT